MARDLCSGSICAAHADCSIAQIKWARMTEKSKVEYMSPPLLMFV
jgi:hypothetical protein